MKKSVSCGHPRPSAGQLSSPTLLRSAPPPCEAGPALPSRDEVGGCALRRGCPKGHRFVGEHRSAAGRRRHKKSVSYGHLPYAMYCPCTSRAGPVGLATLDVHGYEESVSFGHPAARRAARRRAAPARRTPRRGASVCCGGLRCAGWGVFNMF